MVVTGATYGGYDKDNGYYMTIKGYDMDGKAITVNGGFNGEYVYSSKTDASDYGEDDNTGNGVIGIYYYELDTDVNLYTVTKTETLSASDVVMAGDADAVDDDAIVDSNTVFVIANYSAKGAITGYTVKTGFKNIPDMKDAGLDTNNNVIYDSAIAWYVSYVDDDTVPGGDDGIIDLVLVLGSKQTSDVKYTAKDNDTEAFYLLNTTPIKQFSEYNEYEVVMDGKKTTLKVDVEAEQGAAGNYSSIFDVANGGIGEGFYEITAWTGDYAYAVDPVEADEVQYTENSLDVLYFDGNNDSFWKFASCHEGDGTDTNGFVALADNCKIYDLTNGKLTVVSAEDLFVDNNLPNGPANALGYSGVNGIVGNWDNYGFATVIYVVSAD
jgi:hypothetical protein